MTAIVLTTGGMEWWVDRISDLATATGGTATEYWGQYGTGGSGTGATATSGDTSLKVGATEAKIACTISQPSATIWQAVFTQTCARSGGYTVEEMGIYTASGTPSATGGRFIIRANHGAVALATGDSIQYTVQVTFS